MFTIESISEHRIESDYWGLNGTYRETRVHKVLVSIPVKEWNRYRKLGQLGALYGVDISNAVYRLYSGIYATNPTVDDSARAKDGMKRIELYYRTPIKQVHKLRLLKGA